MTKLCDSCDHALVCYKKKEYLDKLDNIGLEVIIVDCKDYDTVRE